MSRSNALTETDLERTAASVCVHLAESSPEAQQRVAEDERNAKASGVKITPTFFINGRRYKGPWDESSN
jgi:NhaA family Na+:H+ antiporter